MNDCSDGYYLYKNSARYDGQYAISNFPKCSQYLGYEFTSQIELSGASDIAVTIRDGDNGITFLKEDPNRGCVDLKHYTIRETTYECSLDIGTDTRFETTQDIINMTCHGSAGGLCSMTAARIAVFDVKKME